MKRIPLDREMVTVRGQRFRVTWSRGQSILVERPPLRGSTDWRLVRSHSPIWMQVVEFTYGWPIAVLERAQIERERAKSLKGGK